ncbi:MAG: glycosyltransferase family 4 protein [Candidatus Gracilibacteria bacterium]|jgi:glycosyltransferase involved in cell wall biosynthesis|nr:glycosyltransferase family 4 protein [Candidatus Gracilibacteria bacterium]
MKICIVSPTDFIGGAELFVFDFIKSTQHEVHLIHSGKEKLPIQANEHILQMSRLKKPSIKSVSDYLASSKALRDRILEINPDIVISNSVRAHILAAKAMSGTKKPLVFWVHDFTFPRFFLRIAEKRANHIMTCSEAVKNNLIQKGVSPQKLSTFKNSIDTQEFSFIEKKGAIKNIGIIGRLDPWKGQDVFLNVAKRYPELNFHIFGASSHYDQSTVDFEKKLKKQAENLKNIEIWGFLESKKALEKIDVLIHASQEKEPFGRVVIESMSRGIAVIASNKGGAIEIISDGEDGFLVEPAVLEISAKLDLIMAYPNMREDFVKKARKKVEKLYSLKNNTKDLSDFLASFCFGL